MNVYGFDKLDKLIKLVFSDVRRRYEGGHPYSGAPARTPSKHGESKWRFISTKLGFTNSVFFCDVFNFPENGFHALLDQGNSSHSTNYKWPKNMS